MSTFAYDHILLDVATGAVNLASASYKAMLVDDTYVPNQQTDHFRSDVSGEVTGASGYTAGGIAVSMTPALNPSLHQLTMTFSTPMWSSASITSRAAVIYISRGGDASVDNLVVYVDLQTDVTSTNGTFTVIFSTPLILQNAAG